MANTLSQTDLNAQLNLWAYDEEGERYVDFEADKDAVRVYFRDEINTKLRFFHDLEEKLEYLFTNEYYEYEVWQKYGVTWDSGEVTIPDGVKELYKEIYAYKFRFPTYMGALKYYTQYNLQSFDKKNHLEKYEDRVVANGLLLGAGDLKLARDIAMSIVRGEYQPATPTFGNAGKAQRGELVSCFLLNVSDDMNSIGRAQNSALQLSKKGGGVALCLTDLREAGAPIKKIENQASGVVPVMKILEDSFSYANQLGTRQGAGAVYLNAHHPDIYKFLDTKRENADEKIRIKTLSLGVVVPDITFELARNNEDMYLFSPYDVQRVYGVPFTKISVTEKYREMVDNPEIKKTKISAREFFQTIAEIQFESGYPYLMFEDTVNEANMLDGRIFMSNLCSEILQVQTDSEINPDLSYKHEGMDVSCNLGSMNVANAMAAGERFGDVVETAVRALTAVSDMTYIEEVPTVRKANESLHSIGLGQMNLHGFFLKEGIEYGSPESIAFTDAYFATVAYHAYRASADIAYLSGKVFKGFWSSKYADPKYLTEKYVDFSVDANVEELFNKYGVGVPDAEDWESLAYSIAENGLYNAYLMAVPPTGSISYINNATASIHPVTAAVEARKEAMVGRVFYPQPYVTNENFAQVKDAYELGYEAVIDVYAAATKHVDQGLSLTLFFKGSATTRDLNRAYIYAWRKGIKTIYYSRIRQDTLEGTGNDECISCQL